MYFMLVFCYFLPGGAVKIVNGGYRGVHASLDSIDIDNYCATVTISKVSLELYSVVCKFYETVLSS